jgi:hypothetical protein
MLGMVVVMFYYRICSSDLQVNTISTWYEYDNQILALPLADCAEAPAMPVSHPVPGVDILHVPGNWNFYNSLTCGRDQRNAYFFLIILG